MRRLLAAMGRVAPRPPFAHGLPAAEADPQGGDGVIIGGPRKWFSDEVAAGLLGGAEGLAWQPLAEGARHLRTSERPSDRRDKARRP